MRPISTTRFRLLTRGANLRQIDSCAVWFPKCDLEQQHSCLKQNDSCKVRFGANFKQEHSCARCFAQALSKTANRGSLDIIHQTHPFR